MRRTPSAPRLVIRPLQKKQTMKFKIETDTLKGLVIHLSIVLGLFCTLAFTVFYEVLPFVTNKDEIVTVPDLKGMSVDGAMEFIRDKDLRIEAVDSSYSPELDPLTVLEQFPQPHAKVRCIGKYV